MGDDIHALNNNGMDDQDPMDFMEEMARQEKAKDIRFRRELTPQEELRKQHMQFHEKHKGHEQMHAEMFIILIVTLLIAQIILVEWKKRHYRWVDGCVDLTIFYG